MHHQQLVGRVLHWGPPAQQAAYFVDVARARTLQALGDRVGAAG
ncbi:MAG: hypothetical protein ACYC6T_18045 [Thermoleophilia bacterium]